MKYSIPVNLKLTEKSDEVLSVVVIKKELEEKSEQTAENGEGL